MTEEQLWFLDYEQEELDLPEAGEFVPTGFIGQVQLFRVYRLWLETPPDDLEAPFDLYRKLGNGYTYFFKNEEDALAVQSEAGSEISPQQVLYVQMPSDSIINRDQATLLKWGDSIGGEIPLVTWASKKHRSTFQLIFLPALVNAVANLRGYNTHFDLDAIDMPSNNFDLIASDDLQAELVGNGDAGYEDSQFFTQRAELWKELGEDNPLTYKKAGAQVKVRGGFKDSPLAVSAAKLDVCLSAARRDWAAPGVWARLKMMPDPVYEATSNAGNRLQHPIIVELFKDKEAAQAAHEKDVEELGLETVAETTEDAPTIFVPQSIVDDGLEAEWESEVTRMVADGENVTKEAAEALGVTQLELRKAFNSVS